MEAYITESLWQHMVAASGSSCNSNRWVFLSSLLTECRTEPRMAMITLVKFLHGGNVPPPLLHFISHSPGDSGRWFSMNKNTNFRQFSSSTCFGLESHSFSALTLLLGGRKGTRPVKTEWVRYLHGYLSEARCKWLHMVQLMPLPPHHL